ncbi:MAG: hypothetical protein V4485_00530, partial [Pseudomonadota bacterium]
MLRICIFFSILTLLILNPLLVVASGRQAFPLPARKNLTTFAYSTPHDLNLRPTEARFISRDVNIPLKTKALPPYTTKITPFVAYIPQDRTLRPAETRLVIANEFQTLDSSIEASVGVDKSTIPKNAIPTLPPSSVKANTLDSRKSQRYSSSSSLPCNLQGQENEALEKAKSDRAIDSITQEIFFQDVLDIPTNAPIPTSVPAGSAVVKPTPVQVAPQNPQANLAIATSLPAGTLALKPNAVNAAPLEVSTNLNVAGNVSRGLAFPKPTPVQTVTQDPTANLNIATSVPAGSAVVKPTPVQAVMQDPTANLNIAGSVPTGQAFNRPTPYAVAPQNPQANLVVATPAVPAGTPAPTPAVVNTTMQNPTAPVQTGTLAVAPVQVVVT